MKEPVYPLRGGLGLLLLLASSLGACETSPAKSARTTSAGSTATTGAGGGEGGGMPSALAPKQYMGWSSWSTHSSGDVTEKNLEARADALATRLLPTVTSTSTSTTAG